MGWFFVLATGLVFVVLCAALGAGVFSLVTELVTIKFRPKSLVLRGSQALLRVGLWVAGAMIGGGIGGTIYRDAVLDYRQPPFPVVGQGAIGVWALLAVLTVVVWAVAARFARSNSAKPA